VCGVGCGGGGGGDASNYPSISVRGLFLFRIRISYQIVVLEPLKHVFHTLKKRHEIP